MNEATLAQTIMTLLILAVFVGFLIWGIKSRQFHNVEDAKYHVFDEADEEEDNHSEEKS